MKDIHEVKDNQPLSFRCRGVARSVHLIYLMGGARTRPQQHHPVPILQKISTDHRKSANNAYSTAQPKGTQGHWWHSTKPTSSVGGASPPPHDQQPFTHWKPLLQPDCAHNYTWVLHLINWGGQWRGRDKRSKVTLREGAHSHLINRAHEQCTAPESRA